MAQSESTSPLRFGIVGTNFISDWFANACLRTDVATPAAVVSREAGRGAEFAARHGFDVVADSIAEIASHVDAVYVASPNLLHHDHAVKALNAGKHVLIEKTMTASLAEAEEIFALADERGLVAMEATRHLHAPSHQLIRDLLPRLGIIRHARLAKCQYSSRYDRFRGGEILRAFDPSLANSALADIGVYVLEPALDLFGEPTSTAGSSVFLHNGFEGAGAMTLTYPDLLVQLTWSKITAGQAPSEFLGEDGAILIDDLGEPTRIEYRPRGDDSRVVWDQPNDGPSTMHHQLRTFASQVRAGRTDPRWRDVTLATRRLMDAHQAANRPG